MSIDILPPTRTALDADQAKALASEIIAATVDQEVFDAGAILEHHPGLARHRSVVVDLAYEEFCRRVDAGETADPEAFVRRFPDVAQSLLKVLEVHQYLERHPDAFVASPAAFAWPQAGEEVGGFSLVHEVGRGGFSRVFLARERDLGDREVIVKICRQANEEAARLGRLEHPHIVPVFSVQPHPHPGLTIICMPYLGSATLADVIPQPGECGPGRARGADVLQAIQQANLRHADGARKPAADAGRIHWTLRRGSYAEAIVEIGVQLGEALAYAHQQGICHCDVKPSNVLLTAEGRALLLDFNLSLQQAGATSLVGGTFPYMAPEQLRIVLAHEDDNSVAEIDPRTDLFALGVTLFQLLTGRLPFAVEDLPQERQEAARQLLVRQSEARDFCGELKRVVSPPVARAIADCLAFDPADRPSSAAEVVQRFRADLRLVPRAGRRVRAHRWALAAAAAILLLAATASGIGLATRAPLHERQYELGVAHLETGDLASASQCFDRALDARHDFVQALLLRGWTDLLAAQREGVNQAERAGLLQSALERFRTSWRQTGNAAAAASLAWCLTQKGTRNEAKDYFAQAAALGLTTPAVLSNWGYCLTATGNSEEAVARLEDAVRLDPKLQAARHNLAMALSHLARDEIMRTQLAGRGGSRISAAEHEARAACLLRSAQEHIDIARQSGPTSADLECVAATIYANASGIIQETDNEAAVRQQELLDKAWRACQAAVELHLPPARLRELIPMAPQLGHDPRFQKLLKRNAPVEKPVPATLLVSDSRNILC
jgi:serine/threonine protein kinase/Tfp pilus assembly protein PilF